MKVHITFVMAVDDVDSAMRIYTRLDNILGMGEPNFEPYPRGGYRAFVNKDLPETDWNKLVLDLLSLAQKIAHGWSLSGLAEDEIDLFADKIFIPGVEWASMSMIREDWRWESAPAASPPRDTRATEHSPSIEELVGIALRG